MTRIADILKQGADSTYFEAELRAAKDGYEAEYVTTNGGIVSDTQTAYSLAICFDLPSGSQRIQAGKRLATLVRLNSFRVGTGFVGTPFVCEALACTGHIQVAYAMLLEINSSYWLYPVTMGATAI